jgi:tetratricopeptide (TPR) repeat protein
MLSPGSAFRVFLILLSITGVANLYAGIAREPQKQTRKRPTKRTDPDRPAPVYTIFTEPPGSEVFIDGKSRGVTDEKGTLAIKNLAKGKHRLTVRHEGYKDNDQFISFAPGESQKVELDKEILTLIVKTLPKCAVWVDGENRGKTDDSGKLAVPNLTYGSHSIIVKGRGYAESTKSYVLASDNAVVEIKPDIDPEWPVIQNFEESLAAGRVILPANSSAYSSYQRLMRDDKSHPELPAMRAQLLRAIDDRGAQIISKVNYNPNQPNRELLGEGRDLYQAASELQNDKKYDARLHYFYGLSTWHDPVQRNRKDRERQLVAIKGEFGKSTEADPALAPALHDLAVIAFNEGGDYATASRNLNAAIAADPNWALPHFTLGRIYIEQQRADEATLEFQRALKLDDKFEQARAGLGIAFALSGDADAGMKLARAAAAKNDSDAYIHYALARIAIENRDFQLAQNEMDQAIRLNEYGIEFNNDTARQIMKDAPKRKKR